MSPFPLYIDFLSFDYNINMDNFYINISLTGVKSKYPILYAYIYYI